jgi:hypothetical protein
LLWLSSHHLKYLLFPKSVCCCIKHKHKHKQLSLYAFSGFLYFYYWKFRLFLKQIGILHWKWILIFVQTQDWRILHMYMHTSLHYATNLISCTL